MAKRPFNLMLVPGTRAEQRRLAEKMLRRGQKPVAIRKVGRRYELRVLDTAVGTTAKKADACRAAEFVGMSVLDLGGFAYTYIDGYGSCKR